MIYKESPELPLGQERVVESAQDGFDVRVDRTVLDGSTVILQDAVFSSFAPSQHHLARYRNPGNARFPRTALVLRVDPAPVLTCHVPAHLTAERIIMAIAPPLNLQTAPVAVQIVGPRG